MRTGQEFYTPQSHETNDNLINRRDFLKMAIIGAGAQILASCVENKNQFDSSKEKGGNQNSAEGMEQKVKVITELKEITPSDNMPKGFRRFEVHSKTETGKDQLVGSFFAMEKEGVSEVDFISNKSHPELFQPQINFNEIQKHFGKENKKVVLQAAGAFTPDWRNIEGLAYENGNNVGQDKPHSGYDGLLVIRQGKPEIINLKEIKNWTQFQKEIIKEKSSVFQQIQVIRDGNMSKAFNNPKLLETRFFVKRKTPNGPTYGIINFSKRMTIQEAVEALKGMDNGISRIEDALYLDTGAVSEAYFYTADNQSHLMVDEQFNTNKQQVTENRKKYTNLIVLASKE